MNPWLFKCLTPPTLCSLLPNARISAGMTYLAVHLATTDRLAWAAEITTKKKKSCFRPQNKLLTLSSLKGYTLCKAYKDANRINFARRKRMRKELKIIPHLNVMRTPSMQPEISDYLKINSKPLSLNRRDYFTSASFERLETHTYDAKFKKASAWGSLTSLGMLHFYWTDCLGLRK